MKKDKLIAFLKRQNLDYQDQVRELQIKNLALEKENENLNELILSLRAEFEHMQDCIESATTARHEYILARNSILSMQKQYENEVNKLLKDIRKRR